jgi:OmcA/MtrC family decaheme c-type cytochrome
MTLKLLKTIGSLTVAVAMLLMLAACGGTDGRDGRDGNDGKPGDTGDPGVDGTNGNVINARALTSEQWADLRLKGEITGVTMGTTPIVKFKLTDGFGTPVVGMNWTSKAATAAYASYPNLAFGIAKLVPEQLNESGRMAAPSRWVNYIVTSNPTAAAPDTWGPTRPTTDNIGTLVDNGNGSYQYTFRRDITQVGAKLDAFAGYNATNVKADLDDVSYQPDYTHRVTVQVSGAYRNTGRTSTRDANTEDGSDSGNDAINILGPANLIYDFIPATGAPVTEADAQRELVSTAACNDCHGVLGHSFHNRGRTDARYCAMCHTDQRKYGYADNTNNKQKNHAVGDFVMIGHTLHLGNRNVRGGRTAHDYNYANVRYKKTGYPMDIKYCVQCHRSDRPGAPAAQGGNWNKTPSRLACGACHDGTDWTAAHRGSVRIDDTSCGTCHGEAATSSAFNLHRPVDVTKLNPATSATYHNFTYDLKSARMDAERRIEVVFKIEMDGVPIRNASGLIPTGFGGGPSFYLVYALPQDGIDKPADFNVNANAALSAVIPTLPAAPDADGYWTATLPGATLQVPANASMVMCYMTRAFTQNDISESDPLYLSRRVTPSKKVVVGNIPGNAARREVTSAEKCNDCHEMLGTSYITRQYGAHGGSMANDPELCGVCHSVNGASRGWPRNISYIVHAVHGIGKRTVQYSSYLNAARPNNPDGIGAYGYPGVLNNCEQCHLPGTYNFGSQGSQAALPNLIWSTVAFGSIAANAQLNSPYIETGKDYGAAFSASAQAAGTTLVNSPITHACVGCHDSKSAIEHMRQNGGAFYSTRSSFTKNDALENRETCLVCHGSGRSADIKKVHGRF